MERLYYIECEDETAETSSRLEAKRIAAEWARRGYKVDTIVVDVKDGAVQQVAGGNSPPPPGPTREGPMTSAPPCGRRES